MKTVCIFLLIFIINPGIVLAQKVLQTPNGKNLVTAGNPKHPIMTELICLPTVFTTIPYNITITTADCGGTITSYGLDPGGILEKGVCWSLTPNPTLADNITTDGTGSGLFLSSITGIDLYTNMVYYVRAYATNSVGTAYGNEIMFTAFPNCGAYLDKDNNSYSTVMINGKCYTRENLHVTTYTDNSLITEVTLGGTWSGLTTEAFCWWGNDRGTYEYPYGALYNWYAVNTGLLCNTGWHVATISEWQAMTNFLGSATAADKLKLVGAPWTPGGFATNSTGFTALPGGTRLASGLFSTNVNDFGYYWTTTAKDVSNSYFAKFLYNSSTVDLTTYIDNKYGMSVRCVKD